MKLSTLVKARKMAQNMDLSVEDNLGSCVFHRERRTAGYRGRNARFIEEKLVGEVESEDQSRRFAVGGEREW